MADRWGIFGGEDPVKLVNDWMTTAAATEPGDVNAMTLATVDDTGMPNARIVLLKEIADGAFVFFTNYMSVKGTELGASPNAALLLHWKTISRQVRIRGTVEKLSEHESDAYYRSRPLESRIGAWASRQSQTLTSRQELEESFAKARESHGDDPPRPPHWGGYRLVPVEIEFWAEAPHRLHDRFKWTRKGIGEDWTIARLNP